MKKHVRFFVFFFLVIISNACTPYKGISHRENLIISDIYYPLSGKIVKIRSYRFGDKPVIWFNMHDDENTGVRAAKKVLKAPAGTLIELKHGGKRNIRFSRQNKSYAFDPNRIYTPEGRKKTLSRWSDYHPVADSITTAFAHFLTSSLLSRAKLIVTLHNNTAGNYSVLDYLPGHRYENDAQKVFVNPREDPDDFFFVTDSILFEKLKRKHFNVVLQNNHTVTDDGSLSVYCGKHQIPYVNIEAQKGHRKKQEEMIEILLGILNESGIIK